MTASAPTPARPVAVLVDAGLARMRRHPVAAVAGDLLPRFEVTVDDGRVGDVAYRSTSCATTVAACEALATLGTGAPVTAAVALTAATVATAVTGLPPGRADRVVAAVSAFHAALAGALAGTASEPTTTR